MPLDADLSFDPRDPYYPLPGDDRVRWAVQVFTVDNGYGLDPASVELEPVGADVVRLRATRYAQLGQQISAGDGRVEVRVERDGPVVRFHIAVDHVEPVKSVKLLLQGLPAEEGWWSPTTPRGTTERGRFQWNYPGPDWATRWAAAGSSVALSIRDQEVQPATLYVGQPPYAQDPIVELVHAPLAPQRGRRCVVPEIRLLAGADEAAVQRDLDEHLTSLESAYGLVPWERRTDVPAWARDTSLVVTLHGQHWTGHVFNTFDQMADILRFVGEHIEPRRVLAYLPGWEGRYYHSYPRYRPGEALGGEAGFAKLASIARDLGVRLMPMFGANGVNVAHYPDWERAAIRNDTNRYLDMLNCPDWDGDRYGEGDQVFLSPGEPRYRQHLADSITAVVDDFGVDAVFLDTAAFWFNDPRHPLHPGYQALVSTLRDRHPDLLLASEGWWDAMLALFPFGQQWLNHDRDFRGPQLLTRFARSTGHLAEGTPGAGSTGVHEQGFRHRPPDRALPGHLPVISFVEDTLALSADEVAAVCEWAART